MKGPKTPVCEREILDVSPLYYAASWRSSAVYTTHGTVGSDSLTTGLNNGAADQILLLWSLLALGEGIDHAISTLLCVS